MISFFLVWLFETVDHAGLVPTTILLPPSLVCWDEIMHITFHLVSYFFHPREIYAKL